MEKNPHAREDLLQEALVYLWSKERQCPGQRPSWYLQGVKFHLFHLRTSGRSLDSPRHRGMQAAFAGGSDGWDDWPDTFEFDEGIMSEVNAHDLLGLLANRVEPMDRIILGRLDEGLGVSEIAEKLHVPRGLVVRHRRQIARLAVKLGVNPIPARPPHHLPSEKSRPATT